MKKIAVFAFALAIIFIVFLSFIISFGNNYIKITQYNHSYTRAFCNQKNLCQDYEVFCKDKRLVGMTPITGAVVQFPETWEDPRSENARNKLC